MKYLSAASVSFLIVMFLVTGFVHAQSWTTCEPLSTPRWNPGSAVIGDDIYIIGGQDSIPPYSSVAAVEIYDASTDTWHRASSMNHDRWGMMVSVVDGKIYSIGGQNGSFMEGYTSVDHVEVYDPVTDTWTELTPMPTARGWGGSAVYNDTIYVFGGYNPSTEDAGTAVEKFYPVTNTWSSDPSMPECRDTFCSIALNNLMYLFGGWGSDLVQEYDPVTNVWSEMTPMPTARGGSGICKLGEYIYVVGGRGGTEAFEAYHPASDTWVTLLSLPTPREGLTAEIVGESLYAITGSVPVNQGGLPYYGICERADLENSYDGEL